jgi:hypothetical protein
LGVPERGTWLASLELSAVYREVIDDALALMDALQ